MQRLVLKSFKIVLIGEPTVGKTSIRRNYFGERFEQNYLTTLGVDFAVKRAKNYIIQIWDMAGQEHYQKLREQYFKGCHGAIVVFDITNPTSLERMNYWIAELDNNILETIPICIVGNKIDLRTPGEKYIGEEMAKTAIMPSIEAYGANYVYVETSAKTGENINLLFETILGQIIEFNFVEFV